MGRSVGQSTRVTSEGGRKGHWAYYGVGGGGGGGGEQEQE